MGFYRKRKPELWGFLDEISAALNKEASFAGRNLTGEKVKTIVEDIYFHDEREAERKKGEKSFMQYYASFLEGMKEGTEKNESGTVFSYGTYRRFNLGYNRLLDYREYLGRTIEWNDLNVEFVKDYRNFLQNIETIFPDRGSRSRNQKASNYSLNSVDTRLKEIKFIVNRYASEHRNFEAPEIVNPRVVKVNNNRQSDNVYLTESDVDKIRELDLSGDSKGYVYARDLFMVGILTAQRVSDYNNIKKENIKEQTITRISGEEHITEKRLVIDLKQQKTGRRVVIPVKNELRDILERYDYELPHLCDQVLNRHIKELCRRAGLNEPIEITSTKGGKEQKNFIPKWELCHSHTARRTGATWMFLSGMNIYDIMKVTGHSTPQMLEKYLKASNLELSEKLINQYDYFKN